VVYVANLEGMNAAATSDFRRQAFKNNVSHSAFYIFFYPIKAGFADTCLLTGFIDRNIFVFIKMKSKMIFFQSFLIQKLPLKIY